MPPRTRGTSAPTIGEPDLEDARVPLADPPPKTVTVEAVVSFNQWKIGDRWDMPLDEYCLALVDRGWIDVVGVDGFELPQPL